jgi:hypothetical protein
MTRNQLVNRLVRSTQVLSENWSLEAWEQEMEALTDLNEGLDQPIDLEPMAQLRLFKDSAISGG